MQLLRRLPAAAVCGAVSVLVLTGSVAVAQDDGSTAPPDTETTEPTGDDTTTSSTSSTSTSTSTSSSSTTSSTSSTSTTSTTSSTTSSTVPRTVTTPAPTTVPRTVPPTTRPGACAPPTTTTTTTTTTLPRGATTTTTTTTTVPRGATTTTTTTTTTLPPCPTTAPTTLPLDPVPTPPAGVPPTALGVPMPKQISDILLTIRLMESGDRYDARPNRGGASGAYQYIDSTWANYGGYPSAYLAPPWVQDERAAMHVQAILDRYNGDVSMVPVIWYYPPAASNPELMDQVPKPHLGNKLTVREYQMRWLDMLEYVVGSPLGYRAALLPPDLKYLSGLPPEFALQPDAEPEIAFPVLGMSMLAAPPACPDDACPPGTSAVIYGQKLQPVLAATDGVVTAVQPGNPVSGAVTLTLTDMVGRTYVYAGFNDDTPGTDDGAADLSLRFTSLATVGTPVRAGQILGFMGDTDPMPSSGSQGIADEVWPHLRLTIYDTDGTRLDTDLMVSRAQRRQACHVGIGPWSVPVEGPLARAARVSDDDVVVSAGEAGSWTIHPSGSITAVGKAALIVAPEDCEWAPDIPFGPGASGNQPPEGWDDPFDIPAKAWVAGAQAADPAQPVVVVRR